MRKNVHLIILSVILTGAVVVLGIQVLGNNRDKVGDEEVTQVGYEAPVASGPTIQETEPFLCNHSSSEIDTSGWQTYRNEEYGFQFKVPTCWVLEEWVTNNQIGSYQEKLILNLMSTDTNVSLNMERGSIAIPEITVRLIEDVFIQDFEDSWLKQYRKNRNLYINGMFAVFYSDPLLAPQTVALIELNDESKLAVYVNSYFSDETQFIFPIFIEIVQSIRKLV